MHTVTGKLNNKKDCIDLLKLNDQEIRDRQTIANKLCDFFATVGKRTADQIAIDRNYVPKQTNVNDKNIFLNPTCDEEIDQIIRNLKNKKSCGIDGFSNNFIKGIRLGIVKPLTYCFNASISQGIFPQ